MTKLLSEDEVTRYRDRGYHFPLDALSASEVADFRRKLEDYEAASGGPIKAEMRHRSHVLFTWIDEMVRHPKILDAIEDVLGPDILCWTTSFFIKEAHDPGFVSWHQDATYWGLSSSDVDRLDRDVAGQQAVRLHEVLAGTHQHQVQHEDTFDKNNLLYPRTGDRGQGRRSQGRLCRAGARPGVASSRDAGPRLGAEPFRRPAHRPCHPLHPDRHEAGGGNGTARRWYAAKINSAISFSPMCRGATSSRRRWRFTRR